MKFTFSSGPHKMRSGALEAIGRWTVEQFRLRRALKSLRGDLADVEYAKADEALLQTVGTLTLVWAVMERALDDVVGVVFGVDGGKSVQATIPVTLDNKLDYLRKARGELAWLAPFVERMRDLQSRIKLARTHRKNVTHGVLEVFFWRLPGVDRQGARFQRRCVNRVHGQL